MDIVQAGLTAFVWLLLTAIIFILALIARFFETMANQRTYYQLFAIPVLFFGGAALRLIDEQQLTGDGWADLLLFAGGVTLAALSFHVYRLMTSGR